MFLCLIREQLSSKLYFQILSHPHHPLHEYLTHRAYDIHYHNHSSCISALGLKTRNMLEGSSLSNIRVCSRSLLNLILWDFRGISCLQSFDNFGKSSTSASVFKSLFSQHRSNCSNFIAIYTNGLRTSNTVGCGIICGNHTFSN